ncbi:hypothetical protein HYH03_011274 [Edaphochlamys debaryana]|uniref:Uncharacterized protein n=1 Tax=Edaphochlamys debaryana TaxID=47281 RepID=A0A835Y3D3_9CHLO|nr:hypothetical protein HYH03_011274 [Edaphochlamys debaryana]|eukprot:KAG2490324.1 hypothetical protein HYH03_011274 [Edaphochlamys debaryana]
MSNKIIYAGLVVSQLLTFAAYVVVSAGAALLQKKANTLTLFNGLEGQDLKDMRDGYSEVFQSTTYIIPYPQQPKYQVGRVFEYLCASSRQRKHCRCGL